MPTRVQLIATEDHTVQATVNTTAWEAQQSTAPVYQKRSVATAKVTIEDPARLTGGGSGLQIIFQIAPSTALHNPSVAGEGSVQASLSFILSGFTVTHPSGLSSSTSGSAVWFSDATTFNLTITFTQEVWLLDTGGLEIAMVGTPQIAVDGKTWSFAVSGPTQVGVATGLVALRQLSVSAQDTVTWTPVRIAAATDGASTVYLALDTQRGAFTNLPTDLASIGAITWDVDGNTQTFTFAVNAHIAGDNVTEVTGINCGVGSPPPPNSAVPVTNTRESAYADSQATTLTVKKNGNHNHHAYRQNGPFGTFAPAGFTQEVYTSDSVCWGYFAGGGTISISADVVDSDAGAYSFTGASQTNTGLTGGTVDPGGGAGAANLHSPGGEFYRADLNAGVRSQRSAFSIPPFEATTAATSDPTDESPCLDWDYVRHRPAVMWSRGGAVYEAVSNTDGDDWETPVVAFATGKYGRRRTDPASGLIIRAALITSGSSKAITATLQARGETAPGTPFAFKNSAGTTMLFTDEPFDLSWEPVGGVRRLILSAKASGATGITEWQSWDDGQTWTPT